MVLFNKLSKKEQDKIILNAKDGDTQSLIILTDNNLKSIYKYAHKFKTPSVDFEDLVQEGIIGLYEAVKRFDINKKNKFITFATYWIINYIAEYSRRNGRTIRVPNYLLADKNKINKYKSEYFNKFKCDPSNEDICNNLKISIKRLNRFYNTKNEILSLDKSIDGENIHEVVPDKNNESNCYIEIFNILTEEERELLELNSGLFGEEKVTYKDLAIKFNKPFQYIKSTIDKSKRKIKKELNNLKYE